jgi:hypothetical protein
MSRFPFPPVAFLPTGPVKTDSYQHSRHVMPQALDIYATAISPN